MDYIKPAEVAATMVETGRRKLALKTYDLFVRGALAGAIVGREEPDFRRIWAGRVG